jgi:thymidylate synthase (FAD)
MIVLDGQGVIQLINSAGNDDSIVRAARVSYNNDAGSGDPDKDKKLIRYLIKNDHTSPLEHVTFTFHVVCPIFVARQWMRHRTWSYNEISARYTEVDMDFYFPNEWREQSQSNKQASAGAIPNVFIQDSLKVSYAEFLHRAEVMYNELLDAGVAREMARMVIPQSVMTRFYGTVDLHNLLRFIQLRDHPHAQSEIREYAVAMKEMARTVAPVAVQAWDDFKGGQNA